MQCGDACILLDVTLLAASTVLVAVSLICFALAIHISRKISKMRAFPRNLAATVFAKTFNVFDPYVEHRSTLENHVGLVACIIIIGSFLFSLVAIPKLFEMKLVLAFITLIMCLGLLMVDEVMELNKNADMFIAAVTRRKAFGEGDMKALRLLGKTLPKLRNYYLVLSLFLCASALTIQHITNGVLTILNEFTRAIFLISAGTQAVPLLALTVGAFMLAVATVGIYFVSGMLKCKIFGFPAPVTTASMEEQFHRMKTFVRVMRHHPLLRQPEPQKPNKAEVRDG